jgi:hypothetical protein
VTKNKVFIGGLTRGQKLERMRLETEVTRAENVLAAIDAASSQSPAPPTADAG